MTDVLLNTVFDQSQQREKYTKKQKLMVFTTTKDKEIK